MADLHGTRLCSDRWEFGGKPNIDSEWFVSWLVPRKDHGEAIRSWLTTYAFLQDAEEGKGKLRSLCPSNSSEGYGNMERVPMLLDWPIANVNNIA
jgi:hypothetical protein